MPTPRTVIIGEALLELSGTQGPVSLGRPLTLGQGGDTLNTAIYLARLGHDVEYATAIGRDTFSRAMLDNWRSEGVGTDLVLTHPTRMPGLYAIETDAQGERSFHYWRDTSAARHMFQLDGSDTLLAQASEADWLYFSGITLSILDEADRLTLIELARVVRSRGGQVAFDPNFRLRGWPDPAKARQLFMGLAPHLDLVLPSLDDEDQVFGSASPRDHIERWHKAGVPLVVAKQGAKGAWVSHQGSAPQPVSVKPAERVIDTTGAGDSFNAGFLGALIDGADANKAATRAAALARVVVSHPGAIAPASAWREIQATE